MPALSGDALLRAPKIGRARVAMNMNEGKNVTETTSQDIETKLSQWRANRDSTGRKGKVAITLSTITTLGWLLFFVKLGQTSSLAMRYSREAQESIGRWAMALILLSLVSFATILVLVAATKRTKAAAAAAKTALQQRLATAGEGERARIESQLRELGA